MGTEPGTITVLVVDDNNEIRAVVREIVETDPRLRVVGDASNGRDALLKLDVLTPDVVVMDVEMPVLGGIDATRMIKERRPQTAVVGCTGMDDDRVRREMREAGASAHIVKSKMPALLNRMIVSVARSQGKPVEVIDLRDDEQESHRVHRD